MSIFNNQNAVYSNDTYVFRDKTISDKIYSIQYLRGFAALFVVLYHSKDLMGNAWNKFVVNGFIGVDIFFIMSGFIIYYITHNKKELNVKTFTIKRFLRIYPVFTFAWIAVFVFYYNNPRVIDMVKSYFLFHIDYNANAPTYKYNFVGPAWTLTYEIYFYLIFCVCGCISHTFRGLLSGICLISLPIIIQYYFNGSFLIISNAKAEFILTSVSESPLKILSNTMFWEFAFGIFIAFLFMKYRHALKNTNTKIKACVSLVLLSSFVYLMFFHGWIRQGVTGMLWPSVILVIAALISEDVIKKEIKPLSFLGDISYSLYLVHWIVIRVIQKHYPDLWDKMHGFGGLTLFVFICLLISFITYKYIEKPTIKLARKLTAN
ncbi:acyltransferase family protein [Citrobacter koseri]|uniref:acyltransferase family protein n=1 Tax=Citrobacter koseri TaxID=545 RepID=UPI001FCC6EDF|nr:acyltransferase [Citrobacter koseri]MDM9068042.1 acyltransferase [Citrobacter koseri]MDM9082289.1 acyltransferase [Citrobacter koseri]MDM9090284.1 acyltransferase [Citrobacter koseri]MDM9096998.1 acyltransferase [Citrobacter koseri]MDM9270531.1 acyltransferase [Citrobacter koseri]